MMRKCVILQDMFEGRQSRLRTTVVLVLCMIVYLGINDHTEGKNIVWLE